MRPSTSSPAKKSMFPKICLSKRLKKIVTAKLKKRKLICEKCDGNFPSWWEIWNHWRSSGHKAPEQCRWCKKKTYTLQSHLCKQHWNLATMCSFCGQLFMFQEDLERHRHCHDSSEYRCFLCGRRRKSEDLLRKHIYSHYLHEKYGCNVCEKRFKKKKNMEKHLRQIHFICQYCGNTCDSVVGLNEHVKIHNDLKCVLCRKVFSQKNRLKYHYQLKHGHQDFYKCSLCFQRFAIKARFLDHMKLKHNGVSKFKCHICEIPFLYWQNYQNHFERIHARPLEADNKFMCSSCDFTTDIKIKLQWHVEKTSGTGFFCKKCQFALDCKGQFDKHMQTHDGECVWTCDYCPRSYSSDDVLSHHISMAHKEVLMVMNPRGYPCLEQGCDRYYTIRSSLKRHIRRAHSQSHSSSTGYLCADNTIVCRTPLVTTDRKRKGKPKTMGLKKKLFLDEQPAQSSSKKGFHHMVKHSNTTEVNVYYCDSCEKFWFTGKKRFRNHMSTHKEDVWEEECIECNVSLESREEAVRHYVEDHLKVKFVQ